MKIIKGDLILKEDTTFDEDIKVEGNIKGCFDLKVKGNINAMNINAMNINAMNINAMNINAWNINAGDINAGDINAGDIIYYAVCFAYKNIKCTSIKGRRINCKHFCLDGEITFKGKEEYCKCCGTKLKGEE